MAVLKGINKQLSESGEFVVSEGLAGPDQAKVVRVYQMCYARPPSEKEGKNAQKFLDEYSKKQSRRSTWAALCQAMFASAEFSHR